MAFSLTARVVFSVDGPPIDHGIVTIENERILAIGPYTRHRDNAEALVDLGHAALLPGLVNAHTHLEFSDLNRPLGQPGIALVDWIRLVIAQRSQRDESQTAGAISRGIVESRRCGVTAVGDIATANAASYPPAPGLELTLMLEVLGFSRDRAASAHALAIERLGEMTKHRNQSNASTPASEDVYRLGVSPHSPYTISPDLLELLIQSVAENTWPVAMHLAETRDELELLSDGTGAFQRLLEERSMWDAEAIPRGSRPLDYLQRMLRAPRSLVIHGNYLAADERALIAANRERMSIVYCPRTHAYFRHVPYPLEELQRSGPRIALGTDSRASNPDLDLWADIQHVARHHPTLDPADILRMGTLSGAEALGREENLGSLKPGKLANLFALPLPPEADGTPRELLSALLHADGGAHRRVWWRGRELLTD